MSRAPTSRPTAWKGLAQALVLYVFICVLAASLAGELLHGVMLGSMSFLVYRFVVVRELITRHHRRGVLRSKDERWEEALVAFRESFRFWDRKRWLDDARGLLLASTATYPFRVLALYNEAWVLYRLGRPEEAGVVLDAVEQEVPNMVAARRLRRALAEPPAQALPAWEDDPLHADLMGTDAAEAS